MPIARNKKSTPADPAAIAAFGAAAELRHEPTSVSAARVTRPGSSRSSVESPLVAGEKAPPRSSLVRWSGEEELRDRLIAYAKDERYKMQDLMVKAMQLGLDQLEKRS